MRCSLALLCLCSSFLAGCVVVINDPEPINSAPTVLSGGTSWSCARDLDSNEFFFEFVASVSDPDGLDDITVVEVELFDAGTNTDRGLFTLTDEGGGRWGGVVWEDESSLRCGDLYDVIFRAIDRDGAAGSLLLEDELPPNAPPVIDPVQTSWSCWQEDGDRWVFEFVTRVIDPNGPADVAFVDVFVLLAGTDNEIGSFALNDEGGKIWGGLVYEDESILRCTEPVDVIFEATDRAGAVDSLSLPYGSGEG